MDAKHIGCCLDRAPMKGHWINGYITTVSSSLKCRRYSGQLHMHGYLSTASLTDVNESDIHVQWNEVQRRLQKIEEGYSGSSGLHITPRGISSTGAWLIQLQNLNSLELDLHSKCYVLWFLPLPRQHCFRKVKGSNRSPILSTPCSTERAANLCHLVANMMRPTDG